ncbi:MFS transporter [Amycolatopsis silviterrae]|uniref:MFS transporter n=1 Tax=Amycolatopsis silviterrae TaxID=1656914 RepID=A0ABW5HIB7_9PSEU
MTAPARYGTIGLLFLTLIFDGFDAVAMSIVVPTLSREWHLPPSAFTAPLVATNVGVVIGLLAANRLCRLLNRRTVICLATLVFTLGAFATALAGNVALLTVIRGLTGLGFGAVLTAATSLAADIVPDRWRETASIVVPLGLSFGGSAAGFVGSQVLATLGWTSVFWLPGIFGLALVAVLFWRLPSVESTAAVSDGSRATVRDLFAPGLRFTTIAMWGLAFLVFATMYSLDAWLPTFAVDYGMTPAQAPVSSAVKGIGGLAGGAVLVFGTMAFGARRMMLFFLALAAVCLGVAGLVPIGTTALLALVGGMGAGLIGACVGQVGLATRIYDGDRRTAGIGWTLGIGRVGSIGGPALAGALLAGGGSPRTALLIMGVVIVAGLAVTVALGRGAVEAEEVRVVSGNPG